MNIEQLGHCTPRPSTASAAWPWLVSVVAFCTINALIPERVVSGYYHYDDNMHLFLPTIYEIGSQLRNGIFPWITDRSWYGGNLIGEGQFALFNPVSLCLYAVMSMIPDAATSALLFSVFHLVLYGIGTFFIAANMGIRAPFAALAAVACSSTNIISYWYASAWWNALVTDAWLVVTLAFWIAFLRSGNHYLAAIITGALSMVSGWPHGWLALGTCILLFSSCAFVEGNRRRCIDILIGGFLTLCMALPAIFPTIDYALTSKRRAFLTNSGDMVGSLESLIGLSWPSYISPLDRIYGWNAEAPLQYAAWFVLPAILLGAKKWWMGSPLAMRWTITGGVTVFALLAQSPEYVLFVRWSMRFLSYFQLFAVIGGAAMLDYIEFRNWTIKIKVLVGLALLGFYFAASGTPLLMATHAEFQAVGLGIALIFFILLFRQRTTSAVLAGLVSSLIIVAITHANWPRNPNVPDWAAENVIALDQFLPRPAYQQASLLLFNWSGQAYSKQQESNPFFFAIESNRDMPSGAMALWSIPSVINGYSAIPQTGMKELFCFNTWGHSCRESIKRIFEHEKNTGVRRDLLYGIDEIRVRNNTHLAATQAILPADWQLVESNARASTYQRDSHARHPGTSVTHVSSGLSLTTKGKTTLFDEQFHVENPNGESGLVVFARPLYPGYSIILNNVAAPPVRVDDVLVGARIPPLFSGELAVHYSPPFLVVTGTIALTALSIATILSLYRRRHAHGAANDSQTSGFEQRLSA